MNTKQTQQQKSPPKHHNSFESTQSNQSSMSTLANRLVFSLHKDKKNTKRWMRYANDGTIVESTITGTFKGTQDL